MRPRHLEQSNSQSFVQSTTGAGFALVGTLKRWQLYPIVVIILIFHLWFSQWWLSHYRFEPGEWQGRVLTYGKRP